jgi:hypothetical protein
LDPAWRDHTVAVIRNPWDRLLSLYEHHRRYLTLNNDPLHLMPILDEGFEAFVMEHSHRVFTFKRHKLNKTDKCWANQTQHQYVDAQTHTIRFEKLEQGWSEYLSQFNINHTPLPHINSKQDKTPYTQRYTQQMIDRVSEIWHTDIDLFGYEFVS